MHSIRFNNFPGIKLATFYDLDFDEHLDNSSNTCVGFFLKIPLYTNFYLPLLINWRDDGEYFHYTLKKYIYCKTLKTENTYKYKTIF